MGWNYTLDELARIIGAEPPECSRSFHAVSTDTRTLQAGEVFFALRGECFDGNAFVAAAFDRGACAAVTRQPCDEGPCLVTADPLDALQRFAAHHRSRYGATVFALTGSCGKTSSKDLVAALLSSRYETVKTQGNLNNEIGCPLSLLQIDAATEYAVIEMGANHRGEIARLCKMAKPEEAAITLVAPAHLEGFGSIENVAKAKGEIVAGLPPDGTFYVNNDDPWCVRLAESFGGSKMTYGRRGDVSLEECVTEESGAMRLRVAPIGELRLPLRSRAHVSNVLLAVAVGLRHGVKEFEAPLRSACGNASRFKTLSIGGADVIDDSYNANPASMAAALDALSAWPVEGKRLAVLGDMFELGAAAPEMHMDVGRLAARAGVDRLYALGEHAEAVVAGYVEGANGGRAEALASPEATAEVLAATLEAGDVLLVKGSRGMRMERIIEALSLFYEKS